MKWGIVFASTSFPQPDKAVALAQAAEAAGFESLWCPEHVIVAIGDHVTPYRGSPDGKMDRLWRRGGMPDPIVWLAYVAAATKTIRLGTNVVILPEHQPTVFAKSVATLDSLSGGRVELGIGVGELPEEYAAVGMEFTNRGQRMDEYIEAMRTLWQVEVATYHGKHVNFDDVRCDPRPANGTVPLHIGGASPAALRRAAKYGDGYFPWIDLNRDVFEALTEVIGGVRNEAEKFGRDPMGIEMTVGGARTVEEAEKFKALGVDRLTIALRSKEIEELRDELGTLGETLVSPTRDL
ncbi:MAG: fgd2 3 [Acidimicrobiia bacterium]|nr:fgd2 3 [Acidimicrobiia bacterium]